MEHLKLLVVLNLKKNFANVSEDFSHFTRLLANAFCLGTR